MDNKVELKNCWELKSCGREKGGAKSAELGVCPAYPEFGHSCWGILRTLCGDKVQGTFAEEKRRNCVVCSVYQLFNRNTGELREEVKSAYPVEMKKFDEILRQHLVSK